MESGRYPELSYSGRNEATDNSRPSLLRNGHSYSHAEDDGVSQLLMLSRVAEAAGASVGSERGILNRSFSDGQDNAGFDERDRRVDNNRHHDHGYTQDLDNHASLDRIDRRPAYTRKRRADTDPDRLGSIVSSHKRVARTLLPAVVSPDMAPPPMPSSLASPRSSTSSSLASPRSSMVMPPLGQQLLQPILPRPPYTGRHTEPYSTYDSLHPNPNTLPPMTSDRAFQSLKSALPWPANGNEHEQWCNGQPRTHSHTPSQSAHHSRHPSASSTGYPLGVLGVHDPREPAVSGANGSHKVRFFFGCLIMRSVMMQCLLCKCVCPLLFLCGGECRRRAMYSYT